MKAKRYFIVAIILLVILGVFLTLGMVNSRRQMMNLIKEEARSLLALAASTQENSIFAEGKYEDRIIETFISVCTYLDAAGINKKNVDDARQNFNLSSLSVKDLTTGNTLVASGVHVKPGQEFVEDEDRLYYDYFTIGSKKYIHFAYAIRNVVYHIESSAEEIQSFSQQFGLNKILNQISANTMVKYLVLQDRKGIIFATPNIQTISRIDDDTALVRASESNVEVSRAIEFENAAVLEIVRPFTVEGQHIGLFRIGISLDSYYEHVRATERQLIILGVILFGAGFVLFFFFMKSQSYINLKELFDKTLGAVEDAVLTVNARGSITGINRTFSDLSSYDDTVLLNHDYFSLFKDDPFDINRVLKHGNKIVDEKVVFGKNIQYSTYPLLDDKKNITGVISVLRNVTVLREFEKEREEAERLKFLGNLVANFAHEIKNPLNGLSIAIQRLAKEFPPPDENYARLTASIKSEIERLNRILNDFLSLARPRVKEEKEFDLSSVVLDTVALIRDQAHEKQVMVKENINKDINLVGNSEDIKRAVLNFLLNGIDALAQVSDRTKELSIALIRQEKAVTLTVSDNGPGVDKEEIKKLFTPYFTTKKGGTGLGLFIAQQIIKDHHGTIDVRSTKNQGTTFVVRF